MDDASIIQLRITAIKQETSLAKTFELEPITGGQLNYKAGQFLTLVFYTRHGEKRRSYSLSSAPREPLAITIKKVDNGEFSRLLIASAKVGDTLLSSGVSGFFVLKDSFPATQPFFFLAAGSGITPCFSLIKTLLYNYTNNVTLIYSNRSQADTIFYEALLTLRNLYPDRFTIRFLFSNVENVYESRLSNWLLRQLLQQYIHPSSIEPAFYICGPFDYMLMADITLRGYGISVENIYRENFSSMPPPALHRPPDTGPHLVTIHLGNETHSIDVQYPDSILAAARKQHLSLPYSCEAGRCGSCVATVISGEVWMAYNEVLVDEEIAKGRVLTCQGFPILGDAEIRF